MKRICAIVIFMLGCGVCLQAQMAAGARHVAQLASQRMYGRGYVNNGIGIAQHYIDSCFKAYGLQPFEYYEGYAQPVSYPVNTFPNEMILSIDGVQLTPGQDFLIDAMSCGGNKTLKCVPFDLNDLRAIVANTNPTEFKKKYQSKYANECLVFNETDSTFTEKERNIIKRWIELDLCWSGLYDIGAIVTITNKKLTHNIASTYGSVPHFIVSDKNLATTKCKMLQFTVAQKLDTVQTANVCGFVDGTDTTAGFIVLTAHYDHLGMMGQQTTFYGANDNASGVAMLLTLAEYYSKNKPRKSIIFIATCGEELGLLGAKALVAAPPFALEDVDFLINIDIAGTGNEGITVVNGKTFFNEFELLTAINNEKHYVSNIKERGEACNSDHCPFFQKNVPSFFIYTTGGSQAYHDIYDKAETLPLNKFNDVFHLLTDFIEKL